MNFSTEMVPGLCALLSGAVMTYCAKWLCRNPKNVPQMKTIGVLLALVGALLIFWP